MTSSISCCSNRWKPCSHWSS